MEEEDYRKSISDLMDYFCTLGRFSAFAGDTRLDLQHKCIDLFKKDYNCTILENENGSLCAHYPNKMILCTEKRCNDEKPCERASISTVQEMITQSKFARCRERFVLPVIFMKNQNVYRSGTLSSSAVFDEKGSLSWTTKYEMRKNLHTSRPNGVRDENNNGFPSKKPTSQCLLRRNKRRTEDIDLLRHWNVRYICDLMVEKKKITKGIQISSSEKVDSKQRYDEFNILATPFPGCELFTDLPKMFREGVFFDWSMGFVNAELLLPDDARFLTKEIDWTRYKDWDIVTLNENYMLLLIRILAQKDGGLLVHCISGWHRTPMFVSLIRLLLWADGVVHDSLDAGEILFLTLAYDWFLFGHDFKASITRGDSMLQYSFRFIEKLYSPKYSIHSDSLNEQQQQQRRRKLAAIHDLYAEVAGQLFGLKHCD